MGGKKKRSMKQISKAQKKKGGKKEKRDTATPRERKSVPGITPPSLKSDKFVGELKKMKIVTPYSVASRYDMRLSVARAFLKDLERQGMIEFVSKSRNLRIYKPAD